MGGRQLSGVPAKHAGAGELSRLESAQPRLHRRRGHARRRGEPDVRRSARTGPRAARHREFLRGARRQAAGRPDVHGRRRPHRRASRGHQPWPVAAALRRQSVRRRFRCDDERRRSNGDRRDAGGFFVPQRGWQPNRVLDPDAVHAGRGREPRLALPDRRRPVAAGRDDRSGARGYASRSRRSSAASFPTRTDASARWSRRSETICSGIPGSRCSC